MGLFSKNIYKVYVDGMHCPHCQKRVEDAFNAIPKTSAKVNLEEKFALVTSKNELTEQQLKETVENIGFTYVKSEK